MADPKTALDLLLEKDEEKCRLLARELDRLNSERQASVQKAMAEIDKDAALWKNCGPQDAQSAQDPKGSESAQSERLLIAASSSWQQGIIGLIAGKLVERFQLPVIVMSNHHDPNVYVASCRSVPGCDVAQFVDNFQDMFLRGGGHAAAGGFSLESDKLALFTEEARSWAAIHWQESGAEIPLSIDLTVSGADCSVKNAEELQKLAPFGAGNPEPVFALLGARVESVRKVGAQRQHRQMRIHTQDNMLLDTITFNCPSAPPDFQPGNTVSVACNLRMHTYSGLAGVQLLLLDAKPE
jgi:single-stranded-DNA-specific exonuclease